eukprot:1160580-Pelagomonas_calceolata.AAC.8
MCGETSSWHSAKAMWSCHSRSVAELVASRLFCNAFRPPMPSFQMAQEGRGMHSDAFHDSPAGFQSVSFDCSV